MASPLRLPWHQQVPAYIHELRAHRRTEWSPARLELCLPQQCVSRDVQDLPVCSQNSDIK